MNLTEIKTSRLLLRRPAINMLNLYFRFKPEAWGKGYANETSRKAIDIGFNKLHEPLIAATVRPDNFSSIKVLEKLGMRFQYKIKDDLGESLFYILKRKN